MKIKYLLLSLSTLFVMYSCTKNESPTESLSLPEKRNVRYAETPEEKQIVAKIEEVSAILMKVCRNSEANKEIAAVIKGGYYEDERVKISDLLNPESSNAYKTEKLKSFSFRKVLLKKRLKKLHLSLLHKTE